MLFTRLANARNQIARCPNRQLTPKLCPSARFTLRNSLRQPCLRSYAKPSVPQPDALAARQAARNASQKAADEAKKKEALNIPKTLLIFHAGATRTTFLALLKVTSLLIGAFFVGIVTPTYVRSDNSITAATKVAFYGLVPPIMIAYLTAPFVTHMRVKLPSSAMSSRANLEKFIRGGGITKDTELQVTTMSIIAKPRTTAVQVGEIMPTSQRMGIINYIRQNNPRLDELRRTRKWYQFRPVTNFYVQPGRPGEARKARYAKTKKDPVEWWVWEDIQERIPLSSSS